jgi:hypothetical protein
LDEHEFPTPSYGLTIDLILNAPTMSAIPDTTAYVAMSAMIATSVTGGAASANPAATMLATPNASVHPH